MKRRLFGAPRASAQRVWTSTNKWWQQRTKGSIGPEGSSVSLDIFQLEDRVLMSATPAPDPQGTPEPPPPNPLLAFEGAAGYGAHAEGGRGGDVYHVTNLNDSGAGSLRFGITSATGPRTIVFDVSGYIDLQSTLNFDNKSYITIAGQTAPGDGITIRNYSTYIANSHDLIFRYIRFRGNDSVAQEFSTVGVYQSNDIIFDHTSVSWGIDETLYTANSHNITLQWSIISEGLYDSHHSKGPHSRGSFHVNGTVSVHHNLYAHHEYRMPLVAQTADVVNNVMYNFRISPTIAGWGGTNPDPFGPTQVNVVNNMYVMGADIHNPTLDYVMYGYTGTTAHVSGNLYDRTIDGQLNGTPGTGVGPYTAASQRINMPAVPTTDAVTAYYQVLSDAGASRSRDAVDTRIIQNVITQTGRLIDSPSDVGGYPVLNSSPAPLDTDQDGMPDFWENQFSHLNRLNAADRNGDFNNDGYTNLEDYLNALATNVNAAPVAHGEAYSTSEDVPLVVGVQQGLLHNDFDLEGEALAAVLVQNPQHGQLQLQANGTFTYTPNANFQGTDHFLYRVTDGHGTSQVVQALVHVNGSNDTPTPQDDAYSTTGPLVTNITTGVLVNDHDTDGNSLVATLVTNPQHGSLQFQANGAFVYTPHQGFQGVDQFTYRVSDGVQQSSPAVVQLHVSLPPVVTPPNDPPPQDPVDFDPHDLPVPVTPAPTHPPTVSLPHIVDDISSELAEDLRDVQQGNAATPFAEFRELQGSAEPHAPIHAELGSPEQVQDNHSDNYLDYLESDPSSEWRTFAVAPTLTPPIVSLSLVDDLAGPLTDIDPAAARQEMHFVSLRDLPMTSDPPADKDAQATDKASDEADRAAESADASATSPPGDSPPDETKSNESAAKLNEANDGEAEGSETDESEPESDGTADDRSPAEEDDAEDEADENEGEALSATKTN